MQIVLAILMDLIIQKKWKMLKNWQLHMLLGVLCAYNIQLLGHALVWFDMTAAHARQFVKITIHRPISNIYSDIIAVWSLKNHDCHHNPVYAV